MTVTNCISLTRNMRQLLNKGVLTVAHTNFDVLDATPASVVASMEDHESSKLSRRLVPEPL